MSLGVPGPKSQIKPDLERHGNAKKNIWCAHGNKDWFISGWYMGGPPKIGDFTPQIIHLFIGFSLIKFIHFGGTIIFGNTHIPVIQES